MKGSSLTLRENNVDELVQVSWTKFDIEKCVYANHVLSHQTNAMSWFWMPFTTFIVEGIKIVSVTDNIINWGGVHVESKNLPNQN